MKRVAICLIVMLGVNPVFADDTVTSRASVRTNARAATEAVASSSYESRLSALEKEVETLKVIVASLSGSQTGDSLASIAQNISRGASVNVKLSAATKTTETQTTDSAISGTSKPQIKEDIADAALSCSKIENKTKCNSSYFHGMVGRESIPNLGLEISDIGAATIAQSCKIGCGADMAASYNDKLKIGVITQTSTCAVLPFYDVEKDYKLRCAAFGFDNLNQITGSVCHWDDASGRCTTADMVCTSDGYCSSSKR